MIPANTQLNTGDFEIVRQPSLTYKLDLYSGRVRGFVDNEEALLQAVTKILSTERYSFVIYSSQYGVELERLIGKDYDFILSDLERTVRDALLADDRITGISDFTIAKTGLNELVASFRVSSILGLTNLSVGVRV